MRCHGHRIEYERYGSRSVDEVAHENNYSIILNTELPAGQKLILFGVKDFDISDLVLKKMGIAINQHKR